MGGRCVPGRGDSQGFWRLLLSLFFTSGGAEKYAMFSRIPCLLPHLPCSPLTGVRAGPSLLDLGDRSLFWVSSVSQVASLGPTQAHAPSALGPSPAPISAPPPLPTPPILATPVLRPPPSASGLISVSFALYCSLTGIIKIRINREVSISLPVSSSSSSSSCLSVSPAVSQTLSGCLSLRPCLYRPSPPLVCPMPAVHFSSVARGRPGLQIRHYPSSRPPLR